MAEKLRSGYTTGTHATAVLVAALLWKFEKKAVDTLEILLPKDLRATIEVFREGERFCTLKGDNDDIDVTKGAHISVRLLEEIPQGLKEQNPSGLHIGAFTLSIWAGDGVGVVTKKGLKISPSHPAINPVPLEMMHENIQEIVKKRALHLHAVFEVKDGESIALQTANAKVGVLGGISILGTRGIVKPVSSSAYIDSIETEIDVAAAQSQEVIVFTLGNSAVDFAKELYDEVSIVEIGNFVYDASERLQKHNFKKMVFVTSVAKMTKVAQGFKNTHNRFGTLDFCKVKECLKNELNIELIDEEFLTLKAVLAELDTQEKKAFVELLSKKAVEQLKEWFVELELQTKQIEVITLPSGVKKEIEW